MYLNNRYNNKNNLKSYDISNFEIEKCKVKPCIDRRLVEADLRLRAYLDVLLSMNLLNAMSSNLLKREKTKLRSRLFKVNEGRDPVEIYIQEVEI